jgi:hypothetical protein
MKISFERTGGFAGMRVAISLDLEALPDLEAKTLKKLVLDADFFSLTEPRDGRTYADGFQYTIAIEGEEQHRTLQLSDGSIPEKMRPLVEYLSLRARRQPRH